MSWYRNLSFFFCLLFIPGCTNTSTTVSPAFYHWQTQFEISNLEQHFVDSLNIKKIYVKFFDVDKGNSKEKAIPLASLEIGQLPKTTIEIIPTIFITNRTLYNLQQKDLEKLSQQIHQKITALGEGLENFQPKEIQIDCDWSLDTKEPYFTLLRFLRKHISSSTKLSATIRLHQIKFFEKTGVPPVDRGMLMFYNMGEVDRTATSNSIIDLSIASQYLSNYSSYPLALDIALPIFSWGVLFRDQKMIKLINNLSEHDLNDKQRFLKAAENQYKVIKSTYLQGYYLYEGDMIRLEQSPIHTVQAAAKKLASLNRTTELTVSLYHLDTMTLKNYSYDQLQSVYDQFLEN